MAEPTFFCRTNTVCIDINDGHPGSKCPTKDWVGFIKDDLKIKADDLVECQLHSITNFLLIKLKTQELYNSVLENISKGVLWRKFNSTVFGWSTTENLANVKVINLTVHINTSKVLKKMEEYGKIIHSKLGTHKDLPGVLDGSLHLKMKLRQGVTLPSFIEVDSMGENLQVFSDFSERVCFKCTKKGHIAPFCKFKSMNAAQKAKSTSWASIVEKGTEGGDIPQAVADKEVVPLQQPPPEPLEKEKVSMESIHSSSLVEDGMQQESGEGKEPEKVKETRSEKEESGKVSELEMGEPGKEKEPVLEKETRRDEPDEKEMEITLEKECALLQPASKPKSSLKREGSNISLNQKKVIKPNLIVRKVK